MTSMELEGALELLPGHGVLVLGDAMLDHYIWGECSRISPEAPVPVVSVVRESPRLGGAANVAHNILALGGSPALVTVTGQDDAGRLLRAQLEERGISTAHLVVDRSRPTTNKTRVIARSQQVVRIDREDTAELAAEALQDVYDRIAASLDSVRGVVISDYGKGVISAQLLEDWLPRFRAAGLPVCVDPKETHFHNYKKVTVLTPNTREAAFAAGRPIRDLASLTAAAGRLLASLEAEHLLVTRGEEGMSLFAPDRPPLHIPAAGMEVYDVTGAGDTVVSTLGLGLASGLPIEAATRLANHAAGLVIRELGTAVPTRGGMLTSLRERGPGGGGPEG